MEYEILEPSHYYHIFNQGNNKENIFKAPKNYTYFLDLLRKHVLPFSEVLAYCLLPNHFHLLIRFNDDIEQKKTSQSLSNMFNAYAKAINKSYDRSGSLFKRKFKRIKILNEDYLIRLVVYIHTNPQHHGLVQDFTTYPHSSYNAYISQKKTAISKDYVMALFGDLANFKYIHKAKSNAIDETWDKLTLE